MFKRFFTLFLALMLVFVLAACKKDPKPKDEFKIAAALEAENGEEVTVIGIVVGYGDGNYLDRGARYLYSPEEDKAIYLYTATDQNNLPKIGQKVKLTGTRDTYNELPQLINYSYEVLEEDIDVLQYYKEVTVKEILDNRDKYLLKPVYIKNVVVASPANSSGNTYFVDDTGVIAVYRFGYIANANIEHGDVVNLYANVTAYYETLQLHTAYSQTFKAATKVTDLTDEEKVAYAKLALYYPVTDITSDITLPTSFPTGVTISWESDKPESISNTGVVTRGQEDVEVKLTATITSGSKTETLELKFKVIAEGVITIAEAREKVKDTDVEIEGIVTRKIGKSFFMQDETAGIYVFNPNNEEVAPGDKVNVKGQTDSFYQAIQIARGSTVTVLSSGNEFEAKVYETVKELEEDNPQGQLITVKNLTVTNVGSGDSFSVDVKDSEGTSFVIRIDNYTGIKASSFSVGDVYLSVTGGLSRYNNDLQLMLSSVDDIEPADLTPEQILERAKNRLDIPNKDSITEDIDLPTQDGDVIITWSSDNKDVITDDGKVTIPQTDTQVKLTATLKLGELTDTKEIIVTVLAQEPEPLTVSETLQSDAGTEVEVTGIVSVLTDKGFLLQDPDGTSITVDFSDHDAEVGDKVIVTGEFGIYYGRPNIFKVTSVVVSTSGNSVFHDFENAIEIDFDTIEENIESYYNKLVKIINPYGRVSSISDTGYVRFGPDSGAYNYQINDKYYLGFQIGANKLTLGDNWWTEFGFKTGSATQYEGEIYAYLYDSTTAYYKFIIIPKTSE